MWGGLLPVIVTFPCLVQMYTTNWYLYPTIPIFNKYLRLNSIVWPSRYSACLQGFWQERQSWNHVMPFPFNPSYLQACGTGLTVTPSPQVTQQFDTVRTYQVSIHLAPGSHQVSGSSDIFSESSKLDIEEVKIKGLVV